MNSGIEVSIIDVPYRDDLVAEVRWASDGWAIISVADNGRDFRIDLYPSGSDVHHLDLSAFEQAISEAKRRLRELDGPGTM